MFRWMNIADSTLFEMTVKMYRDPFVADDTFTSSLKNIELDHQAYRYMQSELFMYRVLDVNFERYIEERGDVERVKKILLPTGQDSLATIL